MYGWIYEFGMILAWNTNEMVRYKCWYGIGMYNDFIIGWRNMILVWSGCNSTTLVSGSSWWCLMLRT